MGQGLYPQLMTPSGSFVSPADPASDTPVPDSVPTEDASESPGPTPFEDEPEEESLSEPSEAATPAESDRLSFETGDSPGLNRRIDLAGLWATRPARSTMSKFFSCPTRIQTLQFIPM